jgi:hypothetical protein
VGSSIMSAARSPAELLAFPAGFFLGIVGTQAAIALAVHRTATIAPEERLHDLRRLSGALLLAAAGYLAYTSLAPRRRGTFQDSKQSGRAGAAPVRVRPRMVSGRGPGIRDGRRAGGGPDELGCRAHPPSWVIRPRRRRSCCSTWRRSWRPRACT